MNDVTSSWWHHVGHVRGLRKFEIIDFLNGTVYNSTSGERSSDEESVEWYDYAYTTLLWRRARKISEDKDENKCDFSWHLVSVKVIVQFRNIFLVHRRRVLLFVYHSPKLVVTRTWWKYFRCSLNCLVRKICCMQRKTKYLQFMLALTCILLSRTLSFYYRNGCLV